MLIAGACVFARPPDAAAQESAPPDIVVTGEGLAPPPGEAAYDTVTIDRDRLTGTASGRIEDALADVAGLASFRRADSRSASPTSQGITLRGLSGNAASRALVLLDGVPQNDPFGGWVPFPAFLPERLARVRVTRGGGSGFHGPGALAGTVSMTSAGPAELPPVSARLSYGSRDSVDARAAGAVRLGSGFFSYAGNYTRGDGFAPVVAEDRGAVDRPAPYEQASLALRGVVDVGDGTTLQAGLSGYTDRRERGTVFTGIKSEGADASLRVVHDGRWDWSVLGYLQTRAFASRFASVGEARDTASPALDQYNVPGNGSGGRIELSPPLGGDWTLRLGADLRHVGGRTQELYIFTDDEPARRRVAGGSSTTAGAFADASLESGPLTLDLGGRVDRWHIGTGSRVEQPLAGGMPVADVRYPGRGGWEATGRVGAALAVAAPVTLRAAAYRGWRLPTLNELYRPYRIGSDAFAANAALSPEHLSGVEGGIDLAAAPSLELAATVFWNRLDDAVANVTLDAGPGNFPGVGYVAAGGAYAQRRNLDAVTSRGVELDAHWQSGPASLDASYAYSDPRVHASGAAAALDGLRPAQTAKHRTSATLAWRDGGFAAALTARYVAPQFEDDRNRLRLDDAVTLDAHVAVPLGKALRLDLRAENIADARIETGIDSDGIVERAAPRTLWLGIGYGLQ